MDLYDVAIIGAGVAGSCAARECARYDMRVVVLEAGLDVAEGATRANSGIVHAGFDPEPGTLKAHYNVRGSKVFPRWARELGFPFRRNGSIVLAFTPEERMVLEELLDRGERNGVEGLELVDARRLREMEPNVSPDAVAALAAPTGGICDPYKLAFYAAENAAENGVEFRFDARVTSVERCPDGSFRLSTEGGNTARSCEAAGSQGLCMRPDDTVFARAVINAAGVHADEISAQAAGTTFFITPRRGDYCLLDTDAGSLFSHTMFQAPGKQGKGVLVTPTVHGNLLVGPDAVAQQEKDATATTRDSLDFIELAARKTYPALSMRSLIANFAGVRATGSTGDFVIGEAEDVPGFFNIACFESPGLTSAPAVAEDIASHVARFVNAGENPMFEPCLHRAPLFHEMSDDEAVQAIAQDPRAGHMMCRCRKVSEADVVHALHTRLPVLCLDAIKWRTEAMMGRCHGGFCMPEIAKVVAREVGIMPDELPKRFAGTAIVERAPEGYGLCANQEARERASRMDDSAALADVCDVAVIGGGAAGIAAAASAAREGARVLMIDREDLQGGILKQCIHNGFGLHRFGEELTGPEYASRELACLDGLPVNVVHEASVLSIANADEGATRDVRVTFASPRGERTVDVGAAVIATGSRERGAGALNTPGTRPAGVFSAGAAQNFMNLQGCLPGREVVILGSGDIGLIMARRMTFAGAHVIGVFEINRQPSGLRRNIVQCLDDFGIPLYTGQTVTGIEGAGRLEAVTVSKVDPDTYAPIPGTERRIPCDTLLLSVGLIPENTLAQEAGIAMDPVTGGAVVDDALQTSMPGVYACGNALHVHDLVDFVSDEGDRAGRSAACRALGRTQGGCARGYGDGSADAPDHGRDTLSAHVSEVGVEPNDERRIPVEAGEGVRYVVPQLLRPHAGRIPLRFRTSRAFEGARIVIESVLPYGSVREEKRKRVLVAVPAEMQNIDMPGKAFADAVRVIVRVEQ